MIPQSVAGAIFSSDKNSVLLIRRRDVPVWVLPGGGIEKDETPETAIVREILEETGFHVKAELRGSYIPVNRLAKPTLLFRCEIIKGKATLSSETSGVRFFPLLSLPQMPIPYPEWIEDANSEGPIIKKTLHNITYLALFKYFLLHPLLVLRFLLSRLGLPFNN